MTCLANDYGDCDICSFWPINMNLRKIHIQPNANQDLFLVKSTSSCWKINQQLLQDYHDASDKSIYSFWKNIWLFHLQLLIVCSLQNQMHLLENPHRFFDKFIIILWHILIFHFTNPRSDSDFYTYGRTSVDRITIKSMS